MIKLQTLVLFASALVAVAQTPGTFVPTGSMAAPRIEGHRATLLNDGRVLITGGFPDVAGAELYDPSSGTFTSAGTMTSPRNHHTATLLNDGRVLIAGGSYGRGPSAELYDPSNGTFTPTGNMVSGGMYGQSAVLLGNGKVLFSAGVFGVPTGAGGVRVTPAPPELYDPVNGTFTSAGEGKLTILGSTATLLSDGKVLLAGGYAVGDTSIYDPATGTSKFLTNLPIWGHTATLLKNGTVLIAAGSFLSGSDKYNDYGQESLASARIYDPSLGRFRFTGSMLEARDGHSATLLPAGLVLVAGGDWNSTDILASAELYDPASGAFTRTGGMSVRRVSHTATLLHDGRVLITGGAGSYSPSVGLASAELYVPPVMAVSSASLLTAPFAPQSLGSLFGSGLAGTTESFEPTSTLPATLGGVSLRVRDSSGVERLAGLLYVSPSQINFQVPAGTASGDITLELLNSPAQVPPVAAQVRPVSPAVFTFENNRAGAYAVRVEPDGAQTILSVQNSVVLDDRPVFLVVYATGIRNRSAYADLQCTIGSASVPVEYAGPEGSGWVPGLDQVNVRLTSTLKGIGVANLMVSIDGVLSNTVSVDVR